MAKPLMEDDLAISQQDFDAFREFLQHSSGICLGEHKRYLVASRIYPVLSDYQITDFSDLLARLNRSENIALRERVVDVMTTNETFWFRDSYPFELLKSPILPKLFADNKSHKLRIWSAASSSGQEPYSISISVEESIRSGLIASYNCVDIIATDLCTRILAMAEKGEYDKISVNRGLSPLRISEHFDKTGQNEWKIKQDIRKRVSFQRLNLMSSYVSLGKFDIIYCRNVLIYFSEELKKDILVRLHQSLQPNGILFLGASESLSGIDHLYELVRQDSAIYYRAK